MKKEIIQIENRSFAYKHSENGALHNLNLTIREGECVLLCGESGCGKTTVTRLINGLIPHFFEGSGDGRTVVCGMDTVQQELYTIAAKAGSVFQNPRSQFFCTDTTSELAFGCENLGMPENEILERVARAERELHLTELMGRNIFNLSGGQRQKIACGSVAAMQPEVMVLDEPTSNLDMNAIEELKQALLLWKKQGKTIVVAEHRIYWLQEICDRVIYMKDGKIAFDIPMSEFQELGEEKIHELGLRSLSIEGVRLPESVCQSMETAKFSDYQFSYQKGKTKALEIENLELPMHSVTAVTGRNGAGKSTFMRCLCGLEKKFRGITILDGERCNAKAMLKKSYMVMQDVNHQLFCESVSDEIRLGMLKENENAVQQITEELDLTDLTARHPMSLSGGQKQRTAIASAALAGKEVLIFDEPTGGLDYRHMKQTAELIAKLREKNKLIFIITHDPELIAGCCSHVLHIEDGKVERLYPLDAAHRKIFMEQFEF